MSTKKRGVAVSKRQLRMRLRRARHEAGKTQAEVAEALDWSQSKILRIENGQSLITVSDLIALLTQYPAIAGDSEELIALAKEARKPTVASKYGDDVIMPTFRTWLEHEAYADFIQQYEPLIVPGVLQTDDYATGIVHGLLGAEVDAAFVSRIVRARVERAAALIGDGGPVMEFIVDEAALRRGIGNEDGSRGYRPMIEQLKYLKKMNTIGRIAQNEAIEPELNPSIALQIVPLEQGAYPAMRSPFELIEFEDEEDQYMMYLEDPDGDQIIKDDYDDIIKYVETFGELKKRLPAPSETNQMIDSIIKLMTEDRNGITPSSRREN